jgi:hypothetical protein
MQILFINVSPFRCTCGTLNATSIQYVAVGGAYAISGRGQTVCIHDQQKCLLNERVAVFQLGPNFEILMGP